MFQGSPLFEGCLAKSDSLKPAVAYDYEYPRYKGRHRPVIPPVLNTDNSVCAGP